jgi:hypothetical protein
MNFAPASPLSADLALFLRTAKRRTYAGLDDDATIATPQLEGSKQLEHRDGDWHYCDIYFGMTRFAGLELVRLKGKPVWAMSYSGGLTSVSKPHADAGAIYRFLRAALMEADAAMPLRGPSNFSDGAFRYVSCTVGDLGEFKGEESIARESVDVYRLIYSGGLLG